MPIRWSALKVSEAAGMVEDFLNQAIEPLECAREAAREAKKIDNLPEYISEGFSRIIYTIDHAIGGSQSEPVGQIAAGIKRVRDYIPSGAVEADQISQKYGSQQSLV